MRPITRSFMMSCRLIPAGDTNPADLSDNYCGDLSYWVGPNDGLGKMFLPYQWNLTRFVRSSGQTAWRNALAAELTNRFTDDSGPIDVGFANAASDSVSGLTQQGDTLALCGYRGLVVNVSWPSYTDTYGGAQENARDPRTGALFADIFATLAFLRQKFTGRTVRATLFCHSMGNYVMAQNAAGYGTPGALDSIMMLAADVDYRLFDPNGPVYPQGLAVSQLTPDGVVCFFSGADTVLWDSGIVNGVDRLGYTGPSNPHSTRPPNVFACDITTITNSGALTVFTPYDCYTSLAGTGSLVHACSKMIPAIVATQVLLAQGMPPSEILPQRQVREGDREIGVSRARMEELVEV